MFIPIIIALGAAGLYWQHKKTKAAESAAYPKTPAQLKALLEKDKPILNDVWFNALWQVCASGNKSRILKACDTLNRQGYPTAAKAFCAYK